MRIRIYYVNKCARVRCNKMPPILVDLQFANKYFSMSTCMRSQVFQLCDFSCASMTIQRIHSAYVLHVVRKKRAKKTSALESNVTITVTKEIERKLYTFCLRNGTFTSQYLLA